MKYDCNKTGDYLHELRRMCDYFEDACTECPLDSVASCLTLPYIKIVQEWSDNHPERTRLDRINELLPFYPKDEEGIPSKFCPNAVGFPVDSCDSDWELPLPQRCRECWLKPDDYPVKK